MEILSINKDNRHKTTADRLAIFRYVFFVINMIVWIFLGMGNSLAENEVVELPGMVGPDLYELYTDARMFITRVKINGHPVKLSNAEGMGSTRIRLKTFSGPHGYRNKVTLNGYLKGGENNIEITFSPSPVLMEVDTLDQLNHFTKKMHSHAIIVKGQLNKGNLGINTHKIQELLTKNKSIYILLDDRQESFDSYNVLDEINVSYKLKINTDHRIAQTKLSECELNEDRSVNFSGTLKLNGKIFREINYQSMKHSGYLRNTLKKGHNEFELSVRNTNGPGEIKFSTRCNLNHYINKVGIAKKYRNIDFGDFFNKRVVPLVDFKFTDKGTYKQSFTFEGNTN